MRPWGPGINTDLIHRLLPALLLAKRGQLPPQHDGDLGELDDYGRRGQTVPSLAQLIGTLSGQRGGPAPTDFDPNDPGDTGINQGNLPGVRRGPIAGQNRGLGVYRGRGGLTYKGTGPRAWGPPGPRIAGQNRGLGVYRGKNNSLTYKATGPARRTRGVVST